MAVSKKKKSASVAKCRIPPLTNKEYKMLEAAVIEWENHVRDGVYGYQDTPSSALDVWSTLYAKIRKVKKG